ncbi:MAG: hypothetical protein WCJ71_10800 [Candidatus Omnitrophota bacterium]
MEDIESLRSRVRQSLMDQNCSCEPSTGGGKVLMLLPEFLELAEVRQKVDFREFLSEKNGLGRKQRIALESVGFAFDDVAHSSTTPRSAPASSKKNPKIIKEAVISFKGGQASS